MRIQSVCKKGTMAEEIRHGSFYASGF